jgi:DNA-directed RNA polymerase sigma subunit (sigma70/sigma32)
MEQRMSFRDFSLDSVLDHDGHSTHLDLLADDMPNQEELVGQREEEQQRQREVSRAL